MDRGQQFPEVEGLYNQIKSQYPDVKFGLQVHPNRIHLDTLIVPKEQRGKGIGTDIMRQVTSAADKNGWLMSVTPSTDFGSSMSALTKFYGSHGFTPNKGRKKNFEISEAMIRNFNG